MAAGLGERVRVVGEHLQFGVDRRDEQAGPVPAHGVEQGGDEAGVGGPRDALGVVGGERGRREAVHVGHDDLPAARVGGGTEGVEEAHAASAARDEDVHRRAVRVEGNAGLPWAGSPKAGIVA